MLTNTMAVDGHGQNVMFVVRRRFAHGTGLRVLGFEFFEKI